MDQTGPARSPVSAPPPRGGRFSTAIRRLIGTLHDWAESGWAGPAVLAWNVAQGSVVPGPADALLAPLGLADPPRVWRLVAWAILGSMLGGLIAYAIGRYAFEDVGIPVMRLFGVGAGELDYLARQFQRHGWMFIIVSSIAPISTKIVCIAAGAFGMPLAFFAFALAVGRAVRFLVVATAVRFAGERMNRWIARTIGPPVTPEGKQILPEEAAG